MNYYKHFLIFLYYYLQVSALNKRYRSKKNFRRFRSAKKLDFGCTCGVAQQGADSTKVNDSSVPYEIIHPNQGFQNFTASK